MFTIYNDSGSDSTMVSNLFIDEYMKSANDAQIKVYLYLLRMMGTHRAASVSDIADQFNHTEKDVVRSLRYWEKKGLLNLDYDSRNTIVSIRLHRPETVSGFSSGRSGNAEAHRVVAFSKPAEILPADPSRENPYMRMASGGAFPVQSAVPADRSAEPASADRTEAGCGIRSVAPETSSGTGTGQEQTASLTVPSSATSSAPSELEALENFRRDSGRAQLLFVIEQYIGKPLSLNEIRIIYGISEGLHFTDDMIDYLLQYCVDRGKKDFRYIKKVAENWASSGIMTPAQAENAAAAEMTQGKEKKSRKASCPKDPEASAVPRSTGKRSGKTGSRTRSVNSFNQFEQNDYDFDALEEELLQS